MHNELSKHEMEMYFNILIPRIDVEKNAAPIRNKFSVNTEKVLKESIVTTMVKY